MTTSPESKWAKGPWEVSSTEEVIEVNGADGVTVHYEDLHGVEQELVAEVVANAHLMAAAPDYDAFASHFQWEVIMDALDKWSREGGSELVALGIIGSGLLKLDELRRAALSKASPNIPAIKEKV